LTSAVENRRVSFLLLYLSICVLVVLYIRHNWGYAVDDSFITFRYSDNLRSGYGLRFNIDERFYGTTAAGYALLVCAVSFLVDPFLRLFGAPEFLGAGHASIPIAGTILSGVSIGGIATILVRLVQIRAPNVLGILLAFVSVILLFTSFAANYVSSHETYTFLFVALVATYAYLIANRPILSAFLMALACSIRPDSALIGFAVFFVESVVALRGNQGPLLRRLRAPLKYAGCLFLLMVCWLLYSRWNFGAFSPETLTAKHAQMLLRDFPGFNLKNLWTQSIAFGLGNTLIFGAITLVSSVLFLASGRWKVARNTDILLFALVWAFYAIGDTTAYLLFDVSIWAWYVIAIMFSIAFVVFALAIAVFSDLWAIGGARGKWLMAVPAVVGLAFVFRTDSGERQSITSWLTSTNFNGHITSYVPAVDFIRSRDPNGAVIVTAEPGAFAFRLGPKYEVIDELGLVSPGVARKIIEKDMDYPFRRWNPKYVIVSWHGLYTPEGRPWFEREYSPVLTFTGPYWTAVGITAHVYQKKQT